MTSKNGQMGYSYLIEKKTLWVKEKLLHYEQFLLFPQCFQKLSLVDASKGYLWSKWLKALVCRGRGSNPLPPAHEADALTSRPSRR